MIFNKEFVKNCKSDKWRLNNLYYIVNKQSEKVKFKENSVQKILNQSNSNRKIVLKARQFGISTSEILRMFDKTIFTPNYTACVLAHEQDSIKKLFRIIRRAYEFLDDRIKPRLDRGGGSKYELYFPDKNSRIYADLESRGDTINWLHISEMGFIQETNKIISTMQAVPLKDGRITIESTPNGMANKFYEIWMDTEANFEKFFFPWFIFDEYKINHAEHIEFTDEEIELIARAKKKWNIHLTKEQIAFRRFKQNELKRFFIQEYPEDDASCFLSSGQSVLDLAMVKNKLDNAKEPILDQKGFKVWSKFNKDHTYVCGADVAEGIGGDWSVAVMIDCNEREVVASIRGQWTPFEFAHKLNELCDYYQGAGKSHPLLAVERNNHGHAVLLELENHIQYSNLYRAKDERLGWKTDLITRPIIIDIFLDAITNTTVIINDKELLTECLTLENSKGKIKAADNKHDDCVMAAAIAIQIMIENGISETYENVENRILL